MKKAVLLSLLLSLLLHLPVKAQAPFTTMDSITINKINALALVHGDMWLNPVTEESQCLFPAPMRVGIGLAGAIWMSAHDGSSNLHVAAQTYRQNGIDYWPGPLNAGATLDYATSTAWAKIWKVNRSDISAFLALSAHDSASTPQSILTWPGTGNVYARGNSGASLTLLSGHNYAPFVDLNGNGIYEPLLGEFPDIKGDQALWWLFSDNGPTHNSSNGTPLGVEIQAMAYAYNRGTLIDNVVYYDYKVTNESANNYDDFRMGMWDNLSIGYYLDNYTGFDSGYRIAINYNGTNDDGLSGGHPVNSYKLAPPIAGITIVHLPGDNAAAGIYVPAGNFISYDEDASLPQEYDNYLHGKFPTGAPIHNYCAGGSPDSGLVYNYMFPGDPSIDTQWSECMCNDNTGDRLTVLATNTFALASGATEDVLFALISTDTMQHNSCPLGSFEGIRTVADTAWGYYLNPPPLSIVSPAILSAHLYPNPSHDVVYLDNAGSIAEETVTVYNTIGQKMNITIQKNNNILTLSVGSLSPGMYYVTYLQGGALHTTKFVEE